MPQGGELIVILVVLAIFLVPLALLVWTLIDLLKHPDAAWVAAGENKVMWALLVVFIGVIGPLLYLAMARPKLIAASTGGSDHAY